MKIRMKQRRLNQFLELVNSDFEKMMDGDKYSLAAHFLFSSPMSLFGKHQTGEQHWKAVIASLPKVQKLFKGFLNKIIGLKEGNALPLLSGDCS